MRREDWPLGLRMWVTDDLDKSTSVAVVKTKSERKALGRQESQQRHHVDSFFEECFCERNAET